MPQFGDLRYIEGQCGCSYACFLGHSQAHPIDGTGLNMLMAMNKQGAQKNTSQGKRGWMYWMFIFMVFLYPVWPVFIEKKIGPLPSLTPQKLLTYALVGLCMLQLAFSSTLANRLRQRLKANQDIVKILGALLLTKVVAGVLAVAPFYALNLVYYETLITVGLLFITIVIVEQKSDLAPIFHAMLFAVCAIGCLSIVEAIAGKNILEPFIPRETGTLALIDKGREGTRRLQGTFASPLLLAEFAAMMIPIVLFATKPSLGALRIILITLGVAVLLAAVYGSRTRTALGFVLIMGGVLVAFALRQFLANRRHNPVLRIIAAFYGGIALLAAIALVVWLIYSLASGYSIDQTLGISERAQTIYQGGRDARLVQLEMAIPKILESPLWGYGAGIGGIVVGFVGSNNMLTLDSYLLLITVDSGIPAMLLILALFGGCCWKANTLANNSTGLDSQWLRMIALSLGCVTFFTIFSPLSDLFPLAFVLIGSLMILRTPLHEVSIA
jgi:hypothetical protein